MKPLFIPLKTEYFNAFKCGEKTVELRQYGKRWNEETCKIGRPAILSKGYGKHERIERTITGFHVRHGSKFNRELQEDIIACYGKIDTMIACIEFSKIDDINEGSAP